MHMEKYIQDGGYFYLVNTDGEVSVPFTAPFKVLDHDMDAAKRARAWFLEYIKDQLGYEPQEDQA
jgi:hypothetical protein